MYRQHIPCYGDVWYEGDLFLYVATTKSHFPYFAPIPLCLAAWFSCALQPGASECLSEPAFRCQAEASGAGRSALNS